MILLQQLIVLLVVICSCNLISAFNPYVWENKYHTGQRRYVVTKGENEQQQQQQQLNDNKYPKNNQKSYKGYRGGKRVNNNNGKRKKRTGSYDTVTKSIRNCKTIIELLDLERNTKMSRFHVSFLWNQASRFMYDDLEGQYIAANPNILKPLVELTLKFSDGLDNPQSLEVIVYAIAKISLRIKGKSILNSNNELWEVLENNIIKAAKTNTFNSKNCVNILWSFAKLNRKSDTLFSVMENQVMVSSLDNGGFESSRSISDLLWSYAKFRHSAPKLFDAISHKIIEKLDTFNSRDITNIVWAYATIRHSSPKLFDAISRVVLEKIDTFNSYSITNTLWAYATLRHSSPKLFDAISKTAVSKIDTFNSQDIANIVWAYTTVRHESPELFDAISHVDRKKLNTFSSRDIANTVWAYATVGHSSPRLFDTLSYTAIKKLDTFNSQTIANTLWSYAKVGHSSPDLFDAVSQMTVEKLTTFNSQSIANTVWAYAKLGHSSPELFDAILYIALKKIDTFNSQSIANTVWAYATVGHSSSPELFDAISHTAIKKINTFNSQELANTVWAYAKIEYYSCPKLFDAISHAAIKKIDTFNAQNIANTMWAFARARHSSPKLFDAISHTTMEKVNTLNSQNIASTICSFAMLDYEMNITTLDTMYSQAISMVEKLKVHEIIKLLWSMAVFDYKDIDAAIPLFSQIAERYTYDVNNGDVFWTIPEEHLQQLHQASLWYSKEHNKKSLLPLKLRAECLLAFIITNNNNNKKSRHPSSRLQRDVVKTLRSLEDDDLVIMGEGIRCNQTGYSIDILIGTKDNPKKRIAIKINKPHHYISNRSLKGVTLLKRRQLSHLAANNRSLISIPYWEWYELSKYQPQCTGSNGKDDDDNNNNGEKRKQRYLQECLHEASFFSSELQAV